MFSALGFRVFRVLGFMALGFRVLGEGSASGKYQNTGPAQVFERRTIFELHSNLAGKP